MSGLIFVVHLRIGIFTNTRTCYYYASYFSVAENSTILGKIKGTDKVVAAVIPYGSGKIVLLPQIYEEEEYKTEDVWKENGKNIWTVYLNLTAA